MSSFARATIDAADAFTCGSSLTISTSEGRTVAGEALAEVDRQLDAILDAAQLEQAA